jgi:hypothetical protein
LVEDFSLIQLLTSTIHSIKRRIDKSIMVLQTDSINFCLNKLVILLNYMGVSSLKFNALTNQFEKCPRWITTIQTVWSFFLNILNFAYMNHVFSFKISNMFVFNIGGRIYIDMSVILLSTVTFLNQRYENLTLNILNDLNKLQLAMEHFKYKRPLKEIVVLSLMFGEALYRFISVSVHIFYHTTSIHDANFLYLEMSFLLFIEYFTLVKILSEGVLILSYLVIAQCCDHFNERFHENDESVFTKYHCLLEVARKLNERFSFSFLLYIGFHFLSTFMWLIIVYCSIHDNEGKILNNIDIFGLIFTFWKLLVVVIIPSESLKKVLYINASLKHIKAILFVRYLPRK